MKESKQVLKYEGNNITFLTGNGIKVNATQMAKPFGKHKRPGSWLQTQSAKDFMDALSDAKNIASADLIDVRKGNSANGSKQGTFMHEDLAIEYARWISPKFAIWTNDKIKELLTTGSVTLHHNSKYSILQIADNVSMKVLPSDKHVFLITTKELARAVGVTEGSIRSTKHRYQSNFKEDVHLISNFTFTDEEQKREVTATVWTQKGVIEQIKYTRQGNGVVFRTWAEQIGNDKPVKAVSAKSSNRKSKHNRLTQERIVDMLIDVTKIQDEEIRASLTRKITGY